MPQANAITEEDRHTLGVYLVEAISFSGPDRKEEKISEDEALRVLACGASVHARDDNGFTALMFAICEGMERLAAALVARGADVNVTCNGGWTPLMWACSVGIPENVRLLLSHGANPDMQDERYSQRRTALMMAISHHSPENVQSLLKAGADIDTLRCDREWNALEYAQGKWRGNVMPECENDRQVEAIVLAEHRRREDCRAVRRATVIEEDTLVRVPRLKLPKGYKP